MALFNTRGTIKAEKGTKNQMYLYLDFLLATYPCPISIRPPLLMADIHLSPGIPFAINQRGWMVDTPVIRFTKLRVCSAHCARWNLKTMVMIKYDNVDDDHVDDNLDTDLDDHLDDNVDDDLDDDASPTFQLSLPLQ